MKLNALTEDQAAARILEIVPPTFHAEVAKCLRMVQFSNWLAGWYAADRKPDDERADFMSQALNEGDGVYRP